MQTDPSRTGGSTAAPSAPVGYTSEGQVQPNKTPPFGALQAFIGLIIYLSVSYWLDHFAGKLIGFGYGMYAWLDHMPFPDPEQLTSRIEFSISTINTLLSAYVVFCFVRSYFPGAIRLGAFAPLGWTKPSLQSLWISALAGSALYITYSFVVLPVALPLALPDPDRYALVESPVQLSDAFIHHSWAMWILLVPVAEEFICRGVLYRGLTNSWGRFPAAITVSVLFVLLHLLVKPDPWPALIAISALAVGTIVARILTNSLVPPIVLHLTYNFGAVLFTYTL